MTERKFARGLLKASTAAELRQTVSQVVRESAVLVSAASKEFGESNSHLRILLCGCQGTWK